MRSSKAPPNQKNRGQFLPHPTRTHRSWHPNLPGSRIELRTAFKSIGLGNVIHLILSTYIFVSLGGRGGRGCILKNFSFFCLVELVVLTGPFIPTDC